MYWSSYQNISQFNLFEYQLPIGDLITGSVPFRKVPIAHLNRIKLVATRRMTIIGTMIPIAISTVMSGLSTGKPTTQKNP